MTSTPADTGQPVLEMIGIAKRFGDLMANNYVDFEVREGEIHALLGENGAGKTTLMNVLSGMYRADAGEIRLRGQVSPIRTPIDAMHHGIGMVHQHFMLIQPFTVAENVIYAQMSKSISTLNLKPTIEKIKEISDRYSLAVDPMALVKDMSVGARQRAEIIRALVLGANILVLDEPTSVLTPQEADDFFVVLREMAKEKVTIIFITHKLDEVMAVADRVTVLRDGQQISTVNTADTNKIELASMMVGREVLFHIEKSEARPGAVTMELKDVVALNSEGRPLLDNVSFALREGEILGVAGVDGNGQNELAQVLMGIRETVQGHVYLNGEDITQYSPKERLQRGIGYIPEDRNAHGLITSFSVQENIILTTHYDAPYARSLFLHRKTIVDTAERLIEEYDVKTSGYNERCGRLSGGNLQKLVLAREVNRDPVVLIASQPTHGLDVGATEFIRERLLEQRDRGRAILLISADLDEVLALSDRIVVMFEGRMTDSIEAKDIEMEALGLLMAGVEDPMSLQEK